MNNINENFYKTFSGTDTIAFIILPNTTPIVLGSLTTLSYSTYREKRPVNLLGKVNVAGYTRGARTVAGTMIFTLINQHWVNELRDKIVALKEFDSLKSDELPLFDIMLVSANEYGTVVQGFLYGVDIVGDGGVISIEDMFSENTINYVARDIDFLSSVNPLSEDLSNYYSSSSDNVSVEIAGLNMNIEDETLTPPLNMISEEENNNVFLEEIKVDINTISFNDVVIKKQFKNSKLCCLAYYEKNKRITNKEIKNISNIKFKDISNAFLFDVESNSFPNYIEILINNIEGIFKYKIKLI